MLGIKGASGVSAPRPLKLNRSVCAKTNKISSQQSSVALYTGGPFDGRRWRGDPPRRRLRLKRAKEPAGALVANNLVVLDERCAAPQQRYAEIDSQFNYPLNFICRLHSAEQEKAMTGIFKAYDRNMQFRTRKDTLGIYLVHLFEILHIFLRLGTDWYIPGISFLSLVMTRI